MPAPPPPTLLCSRHVQALPHKEERFLYVVYPLLGLAAAITMDAKVRPPPPLSLPSLSPPSLSPACQWCPTLLCCRSSLRSKGCRQAGVECLRVTGD